MTRQANMKLQALVSEFTQFSPMELTQLSQKRNMKRERVVIMKYLVSDVSAIHEHRLRVTRPVGELKAHCGSDLEQATVSPNINTK